MGEKVGERVGEKVGEKLTINQKKIIELIKNKQHITISEMAKIVGIAEKNIEYNLKKLKEINFLKRVGPAKGGYWEIIS